MRMSSVICSIHPLTNMISPILSIKPTLNALCYNSVIRVLSSPKTVYEMLLSCRGCLKKGGAQWGNSQVVWRDYKVQCKEKSKVWELVVMKNWVVRGSRSWRWGWAFWHACGNTVPHQCPWAPHSVSYLMIVYHFSPWYIVLVYLPRRLYLTIPHCFISYGTPWLWQGSDVWWLYLVGEL